MDLIAATRAEGGLVKDTPDIVISLLYFIIELYRIILFPWIVGFRICCMKSLFLYRYWLVHYFSVKNNGAIIYEQKIAENVDNSDLTDTVQQDNLKIMIKLQSRH